MYLRIISVLVGYYPDIKQMTRLQFFWYAANVNADDEDVIEYNRNLAEYVAALVSDEGAERVKSLQDARDAKAREHGSAEDVNFKETVQGLFGRSAEVDGASPPLQPEDPRRLSAKDLDVIRIIKKGSHK